MNKVKCTFWLDNSDVYWLKAMSESTGKSQGELVRLAIWNLYVQLCPLFCDDEKESGS